MRLDQSFDEEPSTLSRREIRRMRWEFARLDRIYERGLVPVQRTPVPESVTVPAGLDEPALAQLAAIEAEWFEERARAAVGPMRFVVVFLLVLGLVVLLKTFVPTDGGSRAAVDDSTSAVPSTSAPAHPQSSSPSMSAVNFAP